MHFKINPNKFKNILLFIFILINICSFAPPHKYYFSLTEIKANTFAKSISISSKLFIDDLESALQKKNNIKFDLSKSKDDKAVQNEVFKYINHHLQIYIDGKIVPLNLVGFETDNEVVWIYLEAKISHKEFRQAKIVNSILYDFSDDQTNLVQFNWNNKNYTEKLTYPNKELIVNK